MSRLLRLAALLVVLFGGGYGVLFCLANAETIGLDLVFVRLPPAPVGAWVLAAFILGGVCGLLSASVALSRLGLRARALRRQIEARASVPPDAGGRA